MNQFNKLLESERSNSSIDGAIGDRNKTQRGLKSEESVFVKGHQLYYNFIKPHQALNNYTPAHYSNIYLDLNDKKWENLLMQAIKYQNEGSKNDRRIKI